MRLPRAPRHQLSLKTEQTAPLTGQEDSSKPRTWPMTLRTGVKWWDWTLGLDGPHKRMRTVEGWLQGILAPPSSSGNWRGRLQNCHPLIDSLPFHHCRLYRIGGISRPPGALTAGFMRNQIIHCKKGIKTILHLQSPHERCAGLHLWDSKWASSPPPRHSFTSRAIARHRLWLQFSPNLLGS